MSDEAPAVERQPSGKGFLGRHAAWLCLCGLYLVIAPYFRALENPNENVRVWATRAIAHHGTFAIDPVVATWGPVTDTAAWKGRRFSSKAPGTTLLGVPVHFAHDRIAMVFMGRSPSPMASTWALRVFTVILPLLGFYWWVARRIEAVTGSPFARDLLTIALGAGTMMYPYGLAFVGHAQSAALLFAAFLVLPPARSGDAGQDPSARSRLLAGTLAGLSVVFEYQALLAAAVLGGFALFTLRRRCWPFVLGALLPALLLGAYHTALLDSPWRLPYAHLDDAGYATYHHAQGFLGLGRPRARVLLSAFFSVDYGLFVFSSLLGAGFVMALWRSVRDGSRPAALIALVTVVMAVFLSGMANWRGGWCAAGPRYIAVVVPFCIWGVAEGWKELVAPRPMLGTALLALGFVSVGLCAMAGLFPHFPVQLDNPIYDLVVPLVAAGFAPYSLGTAVGLTGLVSLLPFFACLTAALVVMARFAPGHRAVASAALAAVVLLGALSQTGKQTREDERVRRFVQQIWEPGHRVPRKGAEHGPL